MLSYLKQPTNDFAAANKRGATFSLGFAIRRLSLLTFLLTLLSLSTLPGVSWAQANLVQTVSIGSTVNVCGSDECCLWFVIDVPVSSDELDISLLGSGLDTCFDWTCFVNQTGGGFVYTHPSSGNLKVTKTGGFPSRFSFYLCTHSATDCTPACKDSFVWNTYSGGLQTGAGTGHLTTTCCTPDFDPCGCDQIQQLGTDYICAVKGSGSHSSSVTFIFCPALPCTPGVVTFSGMPAASTQSWTNVGGCTYIKLICPPIGPDISPCDQICIHLPAGCPNHGLLTTMNVDFELNPNPCSYQKYGRFKLAGSGSQPQLTGLNEGGQSYPNPVNASNGFKTTIPFETSAGGNAKITITDAKGVKVCDETENLLGSGKHFFYFTADRLPSGTYYYQIEFPQGVVIVSKTIVIVK